MVDQIQLVYDKLSQRFYMKKIQSGLENFTQISRDQFEQEVKDILWCDKPALTRCADAYPYCNDKDCPHAVTRKPNTDRWYITPNHPGFNAKANNGSGYASEADARGAHRRCGGWM